MKAVFDTNILIDFLNGIETARNELALYEEKQISVISVIETLAGCKTSSEAGLVQDFLLQFQIIELSTPIAKTAAKLRRELHLKVPDAIIYASARFSGCLLVTRDKKDINPNWPDVRIPYQL